MICDASLSAYEGDSPAFWISTIIKHARVSHTCFECKTSIRVGDSYERVAGKWMGHEKHGRIESYAFCLACADIHVEFGDGSRAFGTLWEEMETNWREGAHIQACLDRVSTVAAKSKLLEHWRAWKGLTP